ncbi:MAG TPA: hypothetical protein VGU61_10395 [Noviherbaspirillum sp.]|jgi:hypothetical protein|uniref:hypothetical protein n=1 Tax=Noviherbaspirillum sp. TaxID=1926288 RepID=UPI002DDC977B|nr:hypothetical protein [Noviherbaspirillum sp.]HEV2610663.1 hypothetical protein [Noviherbaspirillum sp.]
MSHLQALQSLQLALDDLRSNRIDVHAFCRSWRSQSALVSALPPRYGQVMEDLLGRMEASSLFTEESCSFSQEDMQASLSTWLDKAKQQLEGRP